MAYDRYAAALYGYCHWMLHDSADAAEALQDTFVVAAATLSELSEPSKLRPWLFALARNECRRRIRPRSATRDEADAANQRADGGPAGRCRWASPTDAADRLTDATMQFRAVGEPADATSDLPMRRCSSARSRAGRRDRRADRCDDAVPRGQRAGRRDDAIPRGRPADRCDDAIPRDQRVGRRDGRPGRRQRLPGASRTAGADPLHLGRHEASRA